MLFLLREDATFTEAHVAFLVRGVAQDHVELDAPRDLRVPLGVSRAVDAHLERRVLGRQVHDAPVSRLHQLNSAAVLDPQVGHEEVQKLLERARACAYDQNAVVLRGAQSFEDSLIHLPSVEKSDTMAPVTRTVDQARPEGLENPRRRRKKRTTGRTYRQYIMKLVRKVRFVAHIRVYAR